MPLRDSHAKRLNHDVLGKVAFYEQMIHDLVHECPGGLGSIASRSGYTCAESLGNEVCPTNKGFKFGALDQFVVLLKTPEKERWQFVRSLIALLGLESHVRADCSADGSGDSVNDHLLNLMVEVGEVTQAFNEAMADKHLSNKERLKIAKEFHDVANAALVASTDALRGGEDG